MDRVAYKEGFELIKKLLLDLKIIFSQIRLNLLLFVLLIFCAALLLWFSGGYAPADISQLALDTFHLAALERVEPNGKLMPVILAFLLPLGTGLILGEGILRVIRIYMGRRYNRKEWDLMVINTFRDHIAVCGAGEMGRQLIRSLVSRQPDLKFVLIDLRPGILAELSLPEDSMIHFQGDMTNIETLREAGLEKAKLAILTSGEDVINLETAYKIQEINPDLEIWVRLHHSGLSDLLDLSRKPQVHFFCPYQQAADSVVNHIFENNI